MHRCRAIRPPSALTPYLSAGDLVRPITTRARTTVRLTWPAVAPTSSGHGPRQVFRTAWVPIRIELWTDRTSKSGKDQVQTEDGERGS